MLTPEEGQRIEDEERQRIARELDCTEVPSKLEGEPVQNSSTLSWTVGIGALVLIGGLIWVTAGNRPPVTAAVKGIDNVVSAQGKVAVPPAPVPVPRKADPGEQGAYAVLLAWCVFDGQAGDCDAAARDEAIGLGAKARKFTALYDSCVHKMVNSGAGFTNSEMILGCTTYARKNIKK
jgi:hypothetical protein